MNRLRRAAAELRKSDRQRKATLQQIEDRLRAKSGAVAEIDLRQVIVSATEDEWKESIQFLEEFETEDLLPLSLQRLAIGGRTLFQQIEAAG